MVQEDNSSFPGLSQEPRALPVLTAWGPACASCDCDPSEQTGKPKDIFSALAMSLWTCMCLLGTEMFMCMCAWLLILPGHIVQRRRVRGHNDRLSAA
mmetsp:Transcript_6971/g.14421  ORF Transcript_6971/g.14421 Transcript_6971/m.14421 type:complete len:97 (-) Transcript_6971:64-354(-)